MSQLFRLISLNAARVLFVGSLLLALYVGLNWALAIEDAPDAESIARAEALRDASESAAAESESETDDTEIEATDAESTPTAVPETVDPAELIAAALPPGETTVQVLDAGGGTAAVDSSIAVLEQFGYNIVSVQSSSRKVERTTVYYTVDTDSKAEADALQARDPRFQVVERNQGLSEGVNIHVLVGDNF